MPTTTTKTTRTRRQKAQPRRAGQRNLDSELKGKSDRQLMEMRICDLSLNLDQTWIQPLIDKLYSELADQKLKIKPRCWFGDEWFSPDGVPGIVIPFFLAHPRLMRLEKKQMFEVEGGTKTSCMRILRHEAGHAIDTAFRLHRKKAYKEVFGNYFDPYPDHYRPRPQSKSYVHHLEPWYSQSHPAEDFAETFAVWLNPKSNWQVQYKGWKAIKKLEFVDSLMKQIGGKTPANRSRKLIDPAHQIKLKLGDFYQSRHEQFDFESPNTFESDLRKLFKPAPRNRTTLTAATFLHRNRNELCRLVSEWTGEYRYKINLVLGAMIDKCKVLDLVATGCLDKLKHRALVMLTVQTTNYLHGGHYQVSL